MTAPERWWAVFTAAVLPPTLSVMTYALMEGTTNLPEVWMRPGWMPMLAAWWTWLPGAVVVLGLSRLQPDALWAGLATRDATRWTLVSIPALVAWNLLLHATLRPVHPHLEHAWLGLGTLAAGTLAELLWSEVVRGWLVRHTPAGLETGSWLAAAVCVGSHLWMAHPLLGLHVLGVTVPHTLLARRADSLTALLVARLLTEAALLLAWAP